MILNSLTDSDDCPYILTLEDLDLLQKIINARQISLWQYRKAQDGEIGGFVPFAVMQDKKKGEVERVNQEINKRLSSAMKKLIEMQANEHRKKRA